MIRLSRFSLCLLFALVPAAAVISGCGQAPQSEKQTSRPVSSGDDVVDAAPADAEAETGSENYGESDAVERGGAAKNGDEEKLATSDGDDERSRSMESARKRAKPENPSPTTAPPPPPAANGGNNAATSRSVAEAGEDAAQPAAPAEPVNAAPPPAAAAPADETFDVVPVYFGTDRAVAPDAKRLKYGTERGHTMQLGRALITVPSAHKVPAIERPWVIEIPYFKVKIYEEKEDPAKHFTLQEISALTREQLLAVVKERLAKSVNFKDHALVFVHGFNTEFDFALYRTAQISYDMKFDGAPFLYSWPSGGKVASYTYDRASAEQAEPHLAAFLKMVVQESGAKSISLIAHSMGNELLLRVLERMRPQAPEGVVISQVIFAAPDVDRDKFDNIARQITDFAKGVTLYAASNDKALGYSERFWGGVPRAGAVPTGGPLVIPGVDTIDVTAVSTDSLGLNHSGYAENNALLNDIKLLLQTGERPPDKRIPILEKVTTDAGGAYWRYPKIR